MRGAIETIKESKKNKKVACVKNLLLIITGLSPCLAFSNVVIPNSEIFEQPAQQINQELEASSIRTNSPPPAPMLPSSYAPIKQPAQTTSNKPTPLTEAQKTNMKGSFTSTQTSTPPSSSNPGTNAIAAPVYSGGILLGSNSSDNTSSNNAFFFNTPSGNSS